MKLKAFRLSAEGRFHRNKGTWRDMRSALIVVTKGNPDGFPWRVVPPDDL